MADTITGDETLNATGYPFYNKGLTIRQHFAAMAMAGYNSLATAAIKNVEDKARWACEDADALITELNKK